VGLLPPPVVSGAVSVSIAIVAAEPREATEHEVREWTRVAQTVVVPGSPEAAITEAWQVHEADLSLSPENEAGEAAGGRRTAEPVVDSGVASAPCTGSPAPAIGEPVGQRARLTPAQSPACLPVLSPHERGIVDERRHGIAAFDVPPWF
jgi:hypothetical protein